MTASESLPLPLAKNRCIAQWFVQTTLAFRRLRAIVLGLKMQDARVLRYSEIHVEEKT